MKGILYFVSLALLICAYVMFFVPPINTFFNIMGVIMVVFAGWCFMEATFGDTR